MTIGKIINSTRIARGLSLSELARRADISKSYLHSIESGATKNPSFVTVMRLGWELDTNPLTWWEPPFDGERMTPRQADNYAGKCMAREMLARAIVLLKEMEGDDETS